MESPSLPRTRTRLLFPFQPYEVKLAVFDLNADSTSGPDSFSGHFFQICWGIIKEDITRMFGFSEVIIDMIWRLVSNNWYSVLVNGQTHGFSHSSRGLKQGDPLSPTLFIIAAEVLSRGLNNLYSNKRFKGYGLPKWSPEINHLAYADDTILFCSADPHAIKMMIKVLKNTRILQTIPVYLLSAMNPPKGVQQIHKIFAKFFWSNSTGDRRKHWVAWDKMCLPKNEGSLGFRSLHDISKALLAKLWWNFRISRTRWST
ncbi:uncharacterized protein [Solanum lycopersicum]|uniref:uncharacterized protein n=1 Tax=Solanum lycopersicum TaxID=4081 RepID=UPI0037493C6D